MVTLKRRLLIYGALWVLTGMMFAFAPTPPPDDREPEDRLRAFAYAPLLVVFGLAILVSGGAAAVSAVPFTSPTVAFIFAGVVAYVFVLAVMTVCVERRRPFVAMCAIHVVQSVLATVAMVKVSWDTVGGG